LRLVPNTSEELAAALAEANRAAAPVRLLGARTKDAMAGPLAPAASEIALTGLRRVLRYEPRDLTISVEAGLPWAELAQLLENEGQMLPLDPPFAHQATVGGVVAANTSGPRRRLYGSARDMVIGMRFATLQGKLIDSGGMVVKNVAGLDMAKLMIGSFGTLAAIAQVNFRVYPRPKGIRTFRWQGRKRDEAIAQRDSVLRGPLQPMAIDLLKKDGEYTLLVEAGGSDALLARYGRDLDAFEALDENQSRPLWLAVRETSPTWLTAHPEGAVVRVSCTLNEVGTVIENLPGPALARAGTGVCYGYFEHAAQAGEWAALNRAGTAVVEFAPQSYRECAVLWPAPGNDLALMKQVKHMFDPQGILNPGRLYGQI
jgi:glycolate oxidase FAD binding subunit